MAKASQHETSTRLPTCASCKRDVGAQAGRIPFNVDDSATTPGERAKYECFCPQCFVYVRSPREPERWRPGCFTPILCTGPKCGALESVAMHGNHDGRPICMHCNSSSSVLVLPPLNGVV